MSRLLACPFCGWAYDPHAHQPTIDDDYTDPADAVPWHAAPAGARGACPGNGDTPAPARTGAA